MKLRHVSAREELASLLLPGRIAWVINRASMTQEEFGRTLGVDRPRVNAWVKGRSGVSPEYAQKIAEFTSRMCQEEIPAELFLSARRSPLEEAAVAVQAAAEELTRIAVRVLPLLEQQEAVVHELRSLVAELRERGSAREEGGGSR